MKKKNVKIFLVFFFLIIFFFFFPKLQKKDVTENLSLDISEEQSQNSNKIKDVNYSSKDAEGNEYIIDASQGEIDYSNNNTIYLTNVRALIKLKNSENIKITSDYGKYNSSNFDTIFSKNVIINYLDNKITGEYLDFSIQRNSMIISRKVIYTNIENILKADVINVDIQTKDTKIFMYENKKQVIIKNNK